MSETGAMATAITSIDYDDTFESLVLHPTSPTFSVAHAASAVADADGRPLLTGYVAGIETAYRVGQSAYFGHDEHGWHITVGTFVATAAAASVLVNTIGGHKYSSPALPGPRTTGPGSIPGDGPWETKMVEGHRSVW